MPISKSLKNNTNSSNTSPDSILIQVEDYVSKNVCVPELGNK